MLFTWQLSHRFVQNIGLIAHGLLAGMLCMRRGILHHTCKYTHTHTHTLSLTSIPLSPPPPLKPSSSPGLSLWDGVVSNVLSHQTDLHLTLVQHYHSLVLPAHSLYLTLLSLVCLSLLDRYTSTYFNLPPCFSLALFLPLCFSLP